jgi:uncharacterized protein (DUF1800 family)
MHALLPLPVPLPVAALVAVAATVSACGGGDGSTPPDAFFDLAAARTDKRVLAAADGSATAQAAASVPTAVELLDWAELAYPTLFPGPKPNLTLDPYLYRHYPETGHYVGVAGSDVYVLGPVVGNNLVRVGTLADFAGRVFARSVAATDAQAARFLLQGTLAASDEAIASVRSLGYAAWLEQEFARAPSASNWDYLVAKGIDVNPDSRNVAIGVDAQIWQRLLSAPDSLRQRVALALSETFVTGFDGVTGAWRQFQLAAYWDLLVQHAFGDFRALLEAVTLNAAMGRYLNTAGNQKEDPATGRMPDENYAREVMQLFTIGLVDLNADGTPMLDGQGNPLESYTQTEVSQLARVFTGWNLNFPRTDTTPEYARRPMVLSAALHETQSASFLGATVPANTDGTTALRIALDTLAGHPNVGPFIGKQLIQRLVSSNPSPWYVARVSAAFEDNGQGVRGDLKAVLRAVLLDEDARSEAVRWAPSHGRIREPMLRFVQWARSFKASSLGGEWNVGNTSDPSASLGQSPQRSPSVFNYFRPGYVPPNTAIGLQALVAPELQITNESSVAGYLNFMQIATSSAHRDIRPDYTAELALAADPAALLARIERLLCAEQLSDATRSTINTALAAMPSATDANRAARVATAVFLVMASPEYLVQK